MAEQQQGEQVSGATTEAPPVPASKKIDPWKLPRPARRTETRTFTDPAQPGVELVLTLGASDVLVSGLAEDAIAAMIARWVDTGEAFPVAGPHPVFLSRAVCQSAGAIYAMQETPAADRYTAADLAALAVTMPEAWLEVVEWAGTLNEQPAAKPAPARKRAKR